MAYQKLSQPQPLTFEDLRGLRAEGYVRDSTLDQRDGFGPDIQRHNLERFAQSYGLVLGERWYTEFVSGRQVKKRVMFQQFIEDAYLDLYDVLLVDHTSRFGRNQEECIRFKSELQHLGKVVVFVSQGIISGSDRDFLNERINETLDEQYSRNLSRYVTAGMVEKASQGLANGMPPLGYRSEFSRSGKREQKVPDWEGVDGDPKVGGMTALIALLETYSSGSSSYQTTADGLNAQGYRTRLGEPFTLGAVKSVVDNPFYEGQVYFHRGKADEQVVAGVHEVPYQVKALWRQCQEVRAHRQRAARPELRRADHCYPFSKILSCHQCGSPYHGEARRESSGEYLVLAHDRRDRSRECGVKPKSRRLNTLVGQFGDLVVSQMVLDPRWKGWTIEALKREHRQPAALKDQQPRLEQALANLRKQHLWGDIDDADYQAQKTGLERQLKLIIPTELNIQIPNLEWGAELLGQMNYLWSHPGVTDQQREELVKEVFKSLTIEGEQLRTVEPKPKYVPLFASIIVAQQNEPREPEPPPSPP
jgi:DNA invertase Pin-like site-specific DNA recombinase